MKFKIETNPYENKKTMFRKKNIEINPGLTVLVGCNGSGKTTLLRQIKKIVTDKGISCMNYDNVSDNKHNTIADAVYLGNFDIVAQQYCSSEGEGIIQNIGRLAGQIGNAVAMCKTKDEKELFILIDAVDSGLSVDTIDAIKMDLFDIVLEEPLNVYLIVSANDYTMVRKEQCFDVYTGNYKLFKDYEDYYKFIMKSRERKDKRDGSDN